MLFDHLHQFLSALIQRADAGYIAILSDGDKAQLRVITGLCTVSLGHCDLRGTDDAFGIHWPHTAFSPALQDVVACKIYLIWSRRGFNEPTFRLYCTSFPHLLQLSICSIEPLLFPGCITKHPHYKYLADADKKNTFDVDRFLSTLRRKRQQVVAQDESFDLYEIDLSDEKAAE